MYGAPLQCTKESDADKSTRIKTATLMLERIEPMLSEVGVDYSQTGCYVSLRLKCNGNAYAFLMSLSHVHCLWSAL